MSLPVPGAAATLDDWLSYLESIHARPIDMGLARVRQVAERMALSDPSLDDASRQLLWQQRVSLLREYAGVQGTRQWLAAQGATLDGALVSTY